MDEPNNEPTVNTWQTIYNGDKVTKPESEEKPKAKRVRRKKPIVVLKRLTFSCDGTALDVELDQVSFSASDSECELCGSHGWVRVSIDVKCPVCGKYHEVELSSW